MRRTATALPSREGQQSLFQRLIADGSTLRNDIGLSPREAQIVAMILQGRTDSQIAGSLSISRNTVHTHIEHR